MADNTTEPKPKRQHTHRLAAILDVDEVVEGHVHGFANFLREYSVVGLAVGFVAGSQVAVVVKQIVASFIEPLFQLFSDKDLRAQSFTVHVNALGSHHAAIFRWGAAVYTLLEFLFILITIYVTIKLFKLDRFQKKAVITEVKDEPGPVSDRRK